MDKFAVEGVARYIVAKLRVFSSHRAIQENTKGLAVVKEELAVIKNMLARMAAAQGVDISDLV